MKKKKPLTEQKLKCDCGEWASPKTFKVEGFKVRGWFCKKCKEIWYSDDINQVLMMNKLKKQPIAVKVGRLGESQIVRIPKDICTAVGLKVGKKVLVYPNSRDTIEIKIRQHQKQTARK